MNRRGVIAGLVATGSMPMSLTGCESRRPTTFAEHTPDYSAEPSLNFRAAQSGRIFGSAVISKNLKSDKPYAEAIANECGMLVHNNELKWRRLRPGPVVYDFRGADWIMNFAQKHNKSVRGHTLVWHASIPEWLRATANSQNAEALMRDHIETVAGRYKNQLHSWDVVNEVVQPEDGNKDGLRNSIWLDAIGPDYIENAFRMTASIDPTAKLTFNENRIEYADKTQSTKREYVLKLLERLLGRGAPIHAMGIQAHLRANNIRKFDQRAFADFLDQVAGMGLEIYITELDVRDLGLSPRADLRDIVVARMAKEFLDVVLDNKAVKLVIAWGLCDKYSWLNTDRRVRQNGRPIRGLPLDSKLRRKRLWKSISDSLDDARTV